MNQRASFSTLTGKEGKENYFFISYRALAAFKLIYTSYGPPLHTLGALPFDEGKKWGTARRRLVNIVLLSGKYLFLPS